MNDPFSAAAASQARKGSQNDSGEEDERGSPQADLVVSGFYGQQIALPPSGLASMMLPPANGASRLFPVSQQAAGYGYGYGYPAGAGGMMIIAAPDFPGVYQGGFPIPMQPKPAFPMAIGGAQSWGGNQFAFANNRWAQAGGAPPGMFVVGVMPGSGVMPGKGNARVPFAGGLGGGQEQMRTRPTTTNLPFSQPATPVLTKRPPILLYLDCDKEVLSDYQCLLRQQIELFEAGPQEIRGNAQGRNTPLVLGQVGIRCRHCAPSPIAARTRGAVYYSQTIEGVYQVSQNMTKVHLSHRCHRVPEDIKTKLKSYQKANIRASGGKQYWSDAVRALNVYEEGRVLRFRSLP